ncbi:MAG TPA: VgrG-related protein [Acidimicrobiales bacterium]|nr:VgrG-related protein [Acidimicrobiales bacterium]
MPRPSVKVDGSDLAAPAEGLLIGLTVDSNLHLPDMFVLTFIDHEHDALQKAHLKVGSKVAVSADGWTSDDTKPLITGEVTAIEAEFDDLITHTVVRGYDTSHRLHRGKRTETYRNVQDSDIARKVASKAGLDIGTIDDSKTTLEHVSQVNQSDWEFLKARSREINFEMLVEDGKFHFRRPVEASTGPDRPSQLSQTSRQLVFGYDLLSFRPRVSAVAQVQNVKVRSWDPKAKQVVIGSAPAATSQVQLPSTPGSLAAPFGDATHVIVDRPLTGQDEADAVASAGAELLGSAAFEAEGIALGNPALRAGVAVNISGVSDDFAGKYTISHTRHVFDEDGYVTHFTVSGRQERSLLGLASGGASNGSASAGGAPIDGVVVGQVTDNNDPDSYGRVKVKLPWLSDSYESNWCRVCQLGAGPDSGAVWLPEVNDEVLVAFEFGDVRRPYVIGGLYNGQDKPKLGDGLFDSGKVKRRGFVSRSGHKFVFFDDGAKSGLALLSSDGNLKVSLNQTNGEIHIHCQGKITVDTDSGDITVKGGANVTVQAQGNLSLKGQAGVKIESSGMVELSGQMIKLN